MSNCTVYHNNQQVSADNQDQAEAQRVVRQPAANVVQFADKVEVHLAIPAVPKDGVNLSSEGSVLRIEAQAKGDSPWGKGQLRARIQTPPRPRRLRHQRQTQQRRPLGSDPQARQSHRPKN